MSDGEEAKYVRRLGGIAAGAIYESAKDRSAARKRGSIGESMTRLDQREVAEGGS